jgi:hypothetical protein
MRKRLLPISILPLLLGLAGCAHQSQGAGGGYAGMAFGDCEFEADCFGGPERTPYSCVFYQSPSMPARMAITVPRHHPAPRVVDRGDWMPGSPSNDSSGSANASSAAPPLAPPPVSREPVVLVSPSGEGRTPRTPN